MTRHQTRRVIGIHRRLTLASYVTVNISLRDRYGTVTDLVEGRVRVWVMSVAAVNHDAPEPSPVVSARPPHVADQLQARLFDEILQCELDELESLPGRIRARKSDRSDLGLHEDLQPLKARINEVRQLLGALRDRFSAM
jgi:hypothetical protein